MTKYYLKYLCDDDKYKSTINIMNNYIDIDIVIMDCI